MAYRQPVPSWRARQLRQQETDREMQQQQNVVGPIMGIENEPAFEDDRAPAAAASGPIAQTEHHSIGKDFILAGRAVFTVAGRDKRFTFRVNSKESENARYPEPTFFVSVLTGSQGDDEHAYTYVGILNARDGSIKLTKGSKYNDRSPAVVALRWTFAHVWAGKELPAPAAVYHEGRCCRCGRPLTDPESILRGIGPDCRKAMEHSK